MWYSLIQQIVRQDPVYYALVSLPPDKNWRLISYPYYTKYASDGENTGSTHLDLNIKDFVESGKGANIVQGGLSLADEIGTNCTTLVLGFQSILTNGMLICLRAGRAMLPERRQTAKLSILQPINESTTNWYLSRANGVTCELHCQKSYTVQPPEPMGCGKRSSHGLPAFPRTIQST